MLQVESGRYGSFEYSGTYFSFPLSAYLGFTFDQDARWQALATYFPNPFAWDPTFCLGVDYLVVLSDDPVFSDGTYCEP